MNPEAPIKTYGTPVIEPSSLAVSWSDDAGKLGTRVVEYLRSHLHCELLAEIEPEKFFPIAGVSIEDDVAVFPESRFYQCPSKSFSLLKSDTPSFEWYDFIEATLDVAQKHCHAKEVFTIGGMVSLSAHTAPRQMIAVSSSPEMKRVMSQYDVATDIEHHTLPGQRPTMSSYMLWMARNRGVPAASLWVPMPFYLVSEEDPRAWKKALQFLDARLNLDLDLRDLDEALIAQDKKIAEALGRMPELEQSVRKLENNQALTQDESEQLATGMRIALSEKH